MGSNSSGAHHCTRRPDTQFAHEVVGSVSARDQRRLGNSVHFTLSAIMFKIPMWFIIAALVFVALIWYAVRKIKISPQISAPTFLSYRQDFFDRVLCRWEYLPRLGNPRYKIGEIQCYCQHCEFIIGTPNEHAQQCPSCSRRAVKSTNPPYVRYGSYTREITGYQPRQNAMRFEDFIQLEIERRIRTGEWQSRLATAD